GVERAGRQVARRATAQRDQDDVRTRGLLPGVPVAVQQAGDDARLRRLLLLGAGLVFRALRIDAAVGIDVGDDHDAGAVRHPLHAAGAAGEVADFARGAGGDVV